MAHCVILEIGNERGWGCRGWQKVFLISILGDDVGGEAVLKHWQSLDLPCKGLVKRPTLSTPSVVYCLNQGTIRVPHKCFVICTVPKGLDHGRQITVEFTQILLAKSNKISDSFGRVTEKGSVGPTWERGLHTWIDMFGLGSDCKPQGSHHLKKLISKLM